MVSGNRFEILKTFRTDGIAGDFLQSDSAEAALIREEKRKESLGNRPYKRLLQFLK